MIKKLLAIGLLFCTSVLHAATSEPLRQRTINLELNKQKENITIEKLYLSYGYATESTKNYDYTLKTLDKKGTLLNKLNFKFVEIAAAPNPEWFDSKTGQQTTIPDISNLISTQSLSIPFSPNTETLLVQDKNQKEITRTKLKDHLPPQILAKIQETETRKNLKKNTTQENIKKEKTDKRKDQPTDITKNKKTKKTALAVLLLAIIAVSIYYLIPLTTKTPKK